MGQTPLIREWRHTGTLQAAAGGPIGMGPITFGEAAARLLDNGYAPLPVSPGTKRPAPSRWSQIEIDEAAVEAWSAHYPGHSVGLRTGGLVGVDLDILDPDLAHQLQALTMGRLGETLVRVGLYPKRLLLYRTDTPVRKMSHGKIEILGQGQQFVAFGRHPDTQQPYAWTTGETPLDVPLDQLPKVTTEDLSAVLAEMGTLLPDAPGTVRSGAQRSAGTAPSSGPVRNDHGLVVDGRDGWLSTLAFHAVHDALDRGAAEAGPIAEIAWERFAQTADLARPRKRGASRYALPDARRKVEDKLRLAAEGRLPSRDREGPQPDYAPARLSVGEARQHLDDVLSTAMDRFEERWSEAFEGTCPQIGIRATVGLGKSSAARRHVLALRDRLLASGAPARIAVFTPSHALAEEAAGEWRAAGLRVAVLKGYETRDPAGRPMCTNLEAVRVAVRIGTDVHKAACDQGPEARCPHFDRCLKQQNRRDVAEAEVIVAPYDALFTGFASDTGSIGVLVIDEGCWQRATTESILPMQAFVSRSVLGLAGPGSQARRAGQMADLEAARQRLADVFLHAPAGPVARATLGRAGLTAELCRGAAQLEADLITPLELRPGLAAADLDRVAGVALHVEAARRVIAAWRALADLLEGRDERTGRLWFRGEGAARTLVVTGLQKVHLSLGGKPVLHLDATLRQEIARRILPDLEVHRIEAAAPHQQLRLVPGGFGKSGLVPDPRAAREENERRARRLAEVVDYVRWQALRGGTTLVVTYKGCEDAFAPIPNVRTAHFNAVAGLDSHREVDRLIVIGRPLPSDSDLVPLCGAIFGHEVRGGYRGATAGLWMRDGRQRAARTMRHDDGFAEVLRRAICEDEVIQAIGRGRGVNRTEANPLEVHVLGIIALPLVHDSILSWECVAPDVVQHMLLGGIAVDSPGDAAALHPELFASPEQAKKAFERAGFKGQTPIGISYREMSLKSAAYLRGGRGRAWQRAWWISGTSDDARCRVEAGVGPVARWQSLSGEDSSGAH